MCEYINGGSAHLRDGIASRTELSVLGGRIDGVVNGGGAGADAGRPWLAEPQVKVLTPKLVQAACA